MHPMKAICGNNKIQPLRIIIFLLTIGLFSGLIAAESQVLLVQPFLTAENNNEKDPQAASANKITIWKKILDENNLDFQIISDTADFQNLSRYKIVVLPGNSCLSDINVDLIYKYLDSGGSVIATGDVGSKDQDGNPRSNDFMIRNFGAKTRKTYLKPNEACAIQLRFGFPGTLALDPGYYLRLTPLETPLYIPENNSIDVAGYWANDGYSESLPDSIKRNPGYVISDRKNSQGRIVWFGSSLNLLHQDDKNWLNAMLFFRQLIRWLSNEGITGINPWPKDYNCAYAIHGDISERFGRIEETVEVIEKSDFSATLNIQTDIAVKYPVLLEEIGESKLEIGSHGNTKESFIDQSLNVQMARLLNSINDLKKFSIEIKGFRPPLLQYDSTTIEAVQKTGLEYIIADNQPDRAYPKIIEKPEWIDTENEQIALFPKSELSNYDLINRFGITNHSVFSEYMTKDMKRVFDLGGLYLLNFHDQITDPAVLKDIIETTSAEAIDNYKTYFTTLNEVADWVILRSKINVFAVTSEKSVELTVVNTNNFRIKNATVAVITPPQIPADKVITKNASAHCTYDSSEDIFYLFLPKLKPGESFSVSLQKRSGLPLNEKTKKYLILFFKVILIAAGIFIIASSWYFFISKKKMTFNKLDPEGYEIADSDTEAQSDESSETEKPEVETADSEPKPEILKKENVENDDEDYESEPEWKENIYKSFTHKSIPEAKSSEPKTVADELFYLINHDLTSREYAKNTKHDIFLKDSEKAADQESEPDNYDSKEFERPEPFEPERPNEEAAVDFNEENKLHAESHKEIKSGKSEESLSAYPDSEQEKQSETSTNLAIESDEAETAAKIEPEKSQNNIHSAEPRRGERRRAPRKTESDRTEEFEDFLESQDNFEESELTESFQEEPRVPESPSKPEDFSLRVTAPLPSPVEPREPNRKTNNIRQRLPAKNNSNQQSQRNDFHTRKEQFAGGIEDQKHTKQKFTFNEEDKGALPKSSGLRKPKPNFSGKISKPPSFNSDDSFAVNQHKSIIKKKGSLKATAELPEKSEKQISGNQDEFSPSDNRKIHHIKSSSSFRSTAPLPGISKGANKAPLTPPVKPKRRP